MTTRPDVQHRRDDRQQFFADENVGFSGLAARADAAAPYVGALWTYRSLPCAVWPAMDADRYARSSAVALCIACHAAPTSAASRIRAAIESRNTSAQPGET